jgi:hypothetical protein
MLSSAGIVVYQTFCACTGDQQVSLYVTPETCESEYHHKHSCEIDPNAEEESSTDDCSKCSEHTATADAMLHWSGFTSLMTGLSMKKSALTTLPALMYHCQSFYQMIFILLRSPKYHISLMLILRHSHPLHLIS